MIIIILKIKINTITKWLGAYYAVNREKSMENSYRKLLKQQIKELEIHIEQSFEKKEELQNQLTRLKMAEFEEDMREESPQQLLKG